MLKEGKGRDRSSFSNEERSDVPFCLDTLGESFEEGVFDISQPPFGDVINVDLVKVNVFQPSRMNEWKESPHM